VTREVWPGVMMPETAQTFRVFQMITAVLEFDRKTGAAVIRHGGVWPSGFFPSCEWIAELPRPDLERARELIAEHLNGCRHFAWTTLPSDIDRAAITLPKLERRDVLPGSNLDTETLIHFGVTTGPLPLNPK
jgi:hypothetical protein